MEGHSQALKRPQKMIPSLRKGNGEWARSDLEKAEVFGLHLMKDVFKPHPPDNGLESFHKQVKCDL